MGQTTLTLSTELRVAQHSRCRIRTCNLPSFQSKKPLSSPPAKIKSFNGSCFRAASNSRFNAHWRPRPYLRACSQEQTRWSPPAAEHFGCSNRCNTTRPSRPVARRRRMCTRSPACHSRHTARVRRHNRHTGTVQAPRAARAPTESSESLQRLTAKRQLRASCLLSPHDCGVTPAICLCTLKRGIGVLSPFLFTGELSGRVDAGPASLAVPVASRLRLRPASSAPRQVRQPAGRLCAKYLFRFTTGESCAAAKHTAALRARAVLPAPSLRNLVREHAATDSGFRPGGFEPPRLTASQK